MFRKKLTAVISYTDPESGKKNLTLYELNHDDTLAHITDSLKPLIDHGRINPEEVTFLINGTYRKQLYNNKTIEGISAFKSFTQPEPTHKHAKANLFAIMVPG